eukprot:SAG31_NODE_370_length_16651_cov_3.511056_1_plen_74_part_00
MLADLASSAYSLESATPMLGRQLRCAQAHLDEAEADHQWPPREPRRRPPSAAARRRVESSLGQSLTSYGCKVR